MKVCPRCKKLKLEDDDVLNSLSHRDGKTYICNDCGVEESFIDLGMVLPTEIENRFVAKLSCSKPPKR